MIGLDADETTASAFKTNRTTEAPRQVLNTYLGIHVHHDKEWNIINLLVIAE